MDNLKKRKPNRLKDYNYSQAGAYFITVCSLNRQLLFGHIEASSVFKTAQTKLSKIGFIIDSQIQTLSNTYEHICVDGYVIMPNHVHLIIMLESSQAPTISHVIQQWKGAITKRVGKPIWQKSFHDHVIRNLEDYQRLQEYIANNPAQWELDNLHPDNSEV